MILRAANNKVDRSLIAAFAAMYKDLGPIASRKNEELWLHVYAMYSGYSDLFLVNQVNIYRGLTKIEQLQHNWKYEINGLRVTLGLCYIKGNFQTFMMRSILK